LVLLADSKATARSDAALSLLAALPRWRGTVLFRAIPAAPRDASYNVIARNRHRWFGRRDGCVLSAEMAADNRSNYDP
jgi:predicted DCC family thiol-disulfide oxidoreductase YuxK